MVHQGALPTMQVTTVVASTGSVPDHMSVGQVPCYPQMPPWAAGSRRGQARVSVARLASRGQTEACCGLDWPGPPQAPVHV